MSYNAFELEKRISWLMTDCALGSGELPSDQEIMGWLQNDPQFAGCEPIVEVAIAMVRFDLEEQLRWVDSHPPPDIGKGAWRRF
jgi:hypothetical protein